jgi:hypothetical protein
MLFQRLTRPLAQLFMLLVAALLVACAGAPTVSVSSADRAAIKSANVKAEVQVPADMFFHGRAQSFAAVGGVIGAVAGQAAAQEPKAQMLEAMKAKGISVSEIVKAEFVRAANAKGGMKFAEGASPADAELSLTVNVYGFGQTQGFSALLYPMMNVSATLKKPDGTVAWQKTEFAGPLNSENKQGYEFEQYMKDPELMRQVLNNIAAIVSRMLVDDLSAGK